MSALGALGEPADYYPDEIRELRDQASAILEAVLKKSEQDQLACEQGARDIEEIIRNIRQQGLDIQESQKRYEVLFEQIKLGVKENLEIKKQIKEHKFEIGALSIKLEQQNKELASRKSKVAVSIQAIANEQEKIEKFRERHNQDSITIAALSNTSSLQAVIIKEQALRIQKLREDLTVLRQKREELERLIDEKGNRVQELQALILTFEQHMVTLLHQVKGNEVWESTIKEYFNPEDPESSLFRRWCYGVTST